MNNPVVLLADQRRSAYKAVEDLGFVLDLAAYVGGLIGVVYGGILILVPTEDGRGVTHHPTMALGIVVVLTTLVMALVLVVAARVALAFARLGLRESRETSLGHSV